jgi:hypothetical protein
MTTSRFLPSVPIVFCACLPLAFAANAAERRPIEEIIPDGATVVIAVRDGAQIRDAILGKSPFFAEPKIRELLTEFGMSPQAISDSFKTETGFALEEVFDACDGPAAIALFVGPDGTIDTPDDDEFAAIGVKDGAATAELWKKVRERLAETRKDEIVRAREDDFEGADIWTLTVREPGDAADDAKVPDEEEHYCLFNGHFVMTSTRDTMEKTILALKGKEVPSLSRKADWKAGVERLGNAVDYVVAIDMKPFMDLLRKTPISNELSGARVSKALGLDDLRGLYIGSRIAPEGTDLRLFIHVPTPRTGIPKLFSPAESALEPDRFASADAIAASASNVSFADLFSEAERILRELAPQQATMLPMMVSMVEQQTQVNLKKDFLELLTPPLYSLVTASATPDESPNQLLYFRSNDAKKALDSLKKLITGGSQGMASLDESEYLGYKISSLDIGIGGLQDEEGDPAGIPEIAFAATDTHLFVSLSGKRAIEDALRGIGKDTRPLTATDDWKRATEALPAQRWNVGFARLGTQWKRDIEMIGTFASMLDTPDLETLAALDPDVLAKYADVAAYETHSDGAGILFSLRMLPPATTTTTPSSKTER